jgi:hypothetical protein
MNKRDPVLPISIAAALIVSAIVYAPMFKGKIPFPADFIFDFPPFDPVKPAYALLPQTNIGDLVTSFYPYRTIAARVIREGTLPLWNPYMLSGAPFLAMAQSALFYPGTVLYYLLPVPVAWSLGFILRRILATVFTAMLLKRIGATLTGSVTAGLIFAFCGFLTGWQGQSMSDAAIWLPLICYSVVRLHADASARSAAIGALAFAMPVLAGHPETAAHLTLTGIAFAAFLWIHQPTINFIKAFIGVGLLALGLASVQVLPTMEWLKYIHHSLTEPWPAPPLHSMLGLVSRDITRAATSLGLSMPEHAAYLAMMTFAAAPLAFLARSARRFVVFFAIMAVMTLSAAYALDPGHWLVSHIPGLNALKNSRLTLVAGFSLAVLAGLGISAVEEFGLSESQRRRFRAVLLSAAGSAVALMLIYVARVIPASEVIDFMRQPRFGLILLVAGAICLALRAYGRLSRSWFALATLLIVGLDLATVTFGAIPFTRPRDVFPPIPLFDKIPKNGGEPFRIAQVAYAYGANFESMYRYSAVGGYEIPLERLKTFLADVSRKDMDSVMLTAEGVLEKQDRRLDMLNARYFVVSKWNARAPEFEQHPDRFRYLHTFGDTHVYENLRAFPRAFVIPVSGVEVIREDSEQLRRLKDPAFDGERHVILPEPPPAWSAQGLTESLPTSVSPVRWEFMRANDFELQVNVTEPSVLVISQTDYPGWRAYVDDRPVPLTRANYAFPAIVAAPGSHRVRFSFSPLSFKAGATLSLLAAAFLSVMVLRGTKRSSPNRI